LDVCAAQPRASSSERLTLAQRAYIINNGHIVHEGPTGEIKARPKVLERYLGV
jgi:branched-chain amino acid transport system ATP-binding protein